MNMVALKKILVVDDEAGIRSLLFDVLSGEGFKVTLARDGEDSLDQLKKGRFDLLITDVNMPRLDGIELLKRMKRAGRRERVIIMSGRSMDQHDLNGDLPQVFTTLQKPFRIPKFLDAVTSALAQPVRRTAKKGPVGTGIKVRKKKVH